MEAELLHALTFHETDIHGVLRRFNFDERLYVSCLKLFLVDPTTGELNRAVEAKLWDSAFTAAHALKGLAGNMGFVPLMHATGRLITAIRTGRTDDIPEYMAQVNRDHKAITDAIRNNITQN